MTLSELAIAELHKIFSDFERMESPEKNWWIFERTTTDDANARLVFTISETTSGVKFLPKAGLRFNAIAELDAQIWSNPNLSDWHHINGLQRNLADFVEGKKKVWCAADQSMLGKVLWDMHLVYKDLVNPKFKKLRTIDGVCDWFDSNPQEALCYAADITFATFNLAASRPERARQIAEKCWKRNNALPRTSNVMANKMRKDYARACENLLLFSHGSSTQST